MLFLHHLKEHGELIYALLMEKETLSPFFHMPSFSSSFHQNPHLIHNLDKVMKLRKKFSPRTKPYTFQIVTFFYAYVINLTEEKVSNEKYIIECIKEHMKDWSEHRFHKVSDIYYKFEEIEELGTSFFHSYILKCHDQYVPQLGWKDILLKMK
jgi:hypothetical protein